jgi:hypothetical protein
MKGIISLLLAVFVATLLINLVSAGKDRYLKKTRIRIFLLTEIGFYLEYFFVLHANIYHTQFRSNFCI